MRKVVVTGYGVVSPVGIGIETFWNSLCAGKSGIDRITQFDAGEFSSQIAGEVKDFDSYSHFSYKEIKRNSRFVRFALIAAQEAVNKSCLGEDKIDPFRVGVVIGSGIGSLKTIEEEYNTFLEKGPKRLSPFLIPRLITNGASGVVAIRFGFKGVNFCTTSACASGSHAIGEAYNAIQQDRADVVLCGGSEAAITPMGVGGFCALKALSRRNKDRKSTRLNSSHTDISRMPSSA